MEYQYSLPRGPKTNALPKPHIRPRETHSRAANIQRFYNPVNFETSDRGRSPNKNTHAASEVCGAAGLRQFRQSTALVHHRADRSAVRDRLEQDRKSVV